MTGAWCDRCQADHVGQNPGGHPCMGHAAVKNDQGEKLRDAAGQVQFRPCRHNAMRGQTKCHMHGGRAPQAKTAGQQRAAEAEVTALARKLIPDADQLTPIVNPLQRLLELAAEADAFRESLRRLANDLDGRIRYAGVGTGAAGGEQLRAEVATYRAAMRDVTDLLVQIARLDIETMLAKVTVAQAEQSMAAMQAGCDAAGLDDEQKARVMAGVGRHLRVVAG